MSKPDDFINFKVNVFTHPSLLLVADNIPLSIYLNINGLGRQRLQLKRIIPPALYGSETENKHVSANNPQKTV